MFSPGFSRVWFKGTYIALHMVHVDLVSGPHSWSIKVVGPTIIFINFSVNWVVTFNFFILFFVYIFSYLFETLAISLSTSDLVSLFKKNWNLEPHFSLITTLSRWRRQGTQLRGCWIASDWCKVLIYIVSSLSHDCLWRDTS